MNVIHDIFQSEAVCTRQVGSGSSSSLRSPLPSFDCVQLYSCINVCLKSLRPPPQNFIPPSTPGPHLAEEEVG